MVAWRLRVCCVSIRLRYFMIVSRSVSRRCSIVCACKCDCIATGKICCKLNMVEHLNELYANGIKLPRIIWVYIGCAGPPVWPQLISALSTWFPIRLCGILLLCFMIIFRTVDDGWNLQPIVIGYFFIKFFWLHFTASTKHKMKNLIGGNWNHMGWW